MATGAAGDGLLRGAFEGCISGNDMGIKRRPYHRNCSCALHNSRGGSCSHAPRCNNVSYPVRRSWSEGCLALMSKAPHPPPSASPAAVAAASAEVMISRRHSMVFYVEEEEEEEDIAASKK